MNKNFDFMCEIPFRRGTRKVKRLIMEIRQLYGNSDAWKKWGAIWMRRIQLWVNKNDGEGCLSCAFH